MERKSVAHLHQRQQGLLAVVAPGGLGFPPPQPLLAQQQQQVEGLVLLGKGPAAAGSWGAAAVLTPP